MRYQSVHEHWVRYSAAAGVDATLHQLRHTHATELVNAGVSLATIRKRLGHRNLQPTLRYAEQSDAVAMQSLEPGGGTGNQTRCAESVQPVLPAIKQRCWGQPRSMDD